MAASLSQSLATFVIPTAERTDPEPVVSCLAEARAEFERGAVREALRLLRRAAESSDDAGNELRAVALARAAADLATELGSIAAPPPSAVASPAAPLTSALSASVAPTPAVAPPPVMAPPAPAVAPPPMMAAPTPPVAPPPVMAPPAPAVAHPQAAAPAPAVALPPSIAPAPVVALQAAAAQAVAPRSITSSSPDSALQQLLDSGRAVRVVVKRSAREEGLYVVRRADGQTPTLGAREAVMLLLEPDEAFFAPDESRS